MLRRLSAQLWKQDGVAMIEATIGTVILLLAALGTVQLVLVFHGALAGHSAVLRAARTMAVTNNSGRAEQTFQAQMTTALRGIQGNVKYCGIDRQVATCQAEIIVPSVLPGAGLFTGNGPTGPLTIPQTGTYPFGEFSGN